MVKTRPRLCLQTEVEGDRPPRMTDEDYGSESLPYESLNGCLSSTE
jgi:hypothetical protein